MPTLKEDLATLRAEADAMDHEKDYLTEWRILDRLDGLVIALEAIRDNRRFNNGVTAQDIAREALDEE